MVLIAHGLTRNCTMDGIPWWGERFREAGWAVAAIDLRGHGRSGDGVPTFGAVEALDIRAGLDACQRLGFPGPRVVMGGSLGALAAQSAALEDERIDALVMLAMPGWPWHGVRHARRAFVELARSELSRLLPKPFAAASAIALATCACFARPIARLVNSAHGRDVLAEGDIRARGLPRRRPLVLSVIGDRDLYDWRMTWSAWLRWRQPSERSFLAPAQAPDQQAWFVLAPGLGHPPASPHLFEWDRLRPLLLEFLAVVAERAQPRTGDG